MNAKKSDNGDEYYPDWAHKADARDSEPDWVDAIPHELWELGEAFFPIPSGLKGWNYPHHIQEERFSADDKILNAYLEAGSSYGICCKGDLAVIDIDRKDYAGYIADKLPDTIWQITGSRKGYHLFYFCPDLENRIILRVDNPESHMAAEGLDQNRSFIHLGEVKCDEHGYVLGPGSSHPSGNDYGPLRGESIETITKGELEDALEQFVEDRERVEAKRNPPPSKVHDREDVDSHSFYELSADDVLPWLEEEKRIAHPVHGSSTGSNFMKNSGGDTFMCWRCQYGSGDGCGLSGPQFLATEATGLNCDDVRYKWRGVGFDPVVHYKGWRKAVEDGLVEKTPLEDTFVRGYAIENNMIEEGENLTGEKYWTVRNAMLYEIDYL